MAKNTLTCQACDVELAPVAISIAETARILSVSDAHIRNLVHAGEIPVIPLNGRQVIPVLWINEQIQKAMSAFVGPAEATAHRAETTS